MHDHRDHMGHMDHKDHKDHMMTTPRTDGRFNSASFMNIESSTLMTTMLLTFLIKAFVWRVEVGQFEDKKRRIWKIMEIKNKMKISIKRCEVIEIIK